ncbi:MAG: S9 family peptidase, partial [Thermoanaerobaculia bacterium]
KVEGVSADDAKALPLLKNWNFSPDKHSVIIPLKGDLYLYAFDSGSLTRLTSVAGDEEEPSFSPDGKSVAFVRKNNLFVLETSTQRERQLTTDGNDNLLNGIFDWVYQEEIYGRGNFHAYWWSPDSSTIAFIQLDEHAVHRFSIPDHLPYLQKVEEELYPKAGDPNPIVRLFTVSAAGGEAREVSIERYRASEPLIVDVSWSPDSSKVMYQIQDREQTWLDLNAADVRAGGPSKTLFRETTRAWVDVNGSPSWLKDGSFLWLSERSGFKHLYRYSADGTLRKQITSGPWEVRTLHGADKANDWIYFSGSERSVLGGDAYRIRVDGSGMKRLTDRPGSNNVTFNPSMTRFINNWSDVETPSRVALHRNDGTQLKIVDANDQPQVRQFRTARPEFLQVKARDGFLLEAMMIKPPGFDPSKKYPVYEFTYSGPHAQSVRNGWSSRSYLWFQLVASQGVIVWVCDNRSASGKGAESAWTAYKNFGAGELRDLEDGLKWLGSQPWVDSSRVLLDGWSFGGYMTSYALTHSTMWSAGIAGGTVSDWRDYDSIYTERVMLTPEHNPEGYKNSSPRFAAKDLHGNLLLLHGTIDDNVHLQNTIQFVYELEKAGKQFRMLLYPKSRHGVSDPALVKQMRTAMLGFIRENLIR